MKKAICRLSHKPIKSEIRKDYIIEYPTIDIYYDDENKTFPFECDYIPQCSYRSKNLSILIKRLKTYVYCQSTLKGAKSVGCDIEILDNSFKSLIIN